MENKGGGILEGARVLLDSLARIGAPAEAPPAPLQSAKETIDVPSSAPPYPQPFPVNPARNQFEHWYIDATDGGEATVQAAIQPHHWVVYSVDDATGGAWVLPGEQAPPTLAGSTAGEPVPGRGLWVTGQHTLHVPGRGTFLSLRFVGDQGWIVIAATNMDADRY